MRTNRPHRPGGQTPPKWGRRTIQVPINFDRDMAAYLHARAKREGTSFAEQVRCHVEWGQEAVEMEAAE